MFAPVAGAEAAETVEVRITAEPGMRYDRVRFRVPAAAAVKLVFASRDPAMLHNLLIVEPGSRSEVVAAAMAMGPEGLQRHYVPDSAAVLHATRLLSAGRSQTLGFTAPAEEGVYPYVCTFPGHGFVMYGAMYVGDRAPPPLAEDPHVPPYARRRPGDDGALHAFEPLRPMVYRILMPDASPAAIAAALPGDISYCWDAGPCRLRYVWRGGFIDPMPHWSGAGSDFAKVEGRIYYRATTGFPLRPGGADRAPRTAFHGYRLVDGGYPEFRYTVDGCAVRELIRPAADGEALERTFAVEGLDEPLYFVTDPMAGVRFEPSVGVWEREGVLRLSAEEGRRFTLRMVERPGHAPLAYFSMDDVMAGAGPLPQPGVVGRALRFDGERHAIETGISAEALRAGGTLMAWVRCPDQGIRGQAPDQGIRGQAADQGIQGQAPDQGIRGQAADQDFRGRGRPDSRTIFAIAGSADGRLALRYVHNGGQTLLNLSGANPSASSGRAAGVDASAPLVSETGSGGEPVAANRWRHIAWRVDAGSASVFLDGQRVIRAEAAELPPDGEVHIGSGGGDEHFRGERFRGEHFRGLIDEVRIYDRALDEREIRMIHERERSHLERSE